MTPEINAHALDTLFHAARTHSAWLDKPVDAGVLKQIYDLTKMGPTSANCQPLRVTYITTPEAREKLRPCLDKGNIDKTMSAPVTAILAMDLEFYNYLPTLFPHTDAKSWFVGKPDYIYNTAFRNSAIQGGYFILAARALGLDCGPMSGFDNTKLDQAFFAGTSIKSNFLVNLGYGDATQLHPRSPRPSFDEFCKII